MRNIKMDMSKGPPGMGAKPAAKEGDVESTAGTSTAEGTEGDGGAYDGRACVGGEVGRGGG